MARDRETISMKGDASRYYCDTPIERNRTTICGREFRAVGPEFHFDGLAGSTSREVEDIRGDVSGP